METGRISQSDYDRRLANWQYGKLALNSLAAGLAAPTDSGLGIASAAASPAAAHAVGQYFKGLAQENLLGGKTETAELTAAQETARAVAHGVIAAATAAAGDHNALTAAINAGGAEAAAPYVSQWLYGEKDGSKLTAEQKETVSGILSLGGAAVGAVAGGSGSDWVAGRQAAQNAVENNAFRGLETLAGGDKGMTSMAGAVSLYEAQMKSGKTQEEAKKAVESYLKGYGLKQHTGSEILLYGSMTAPVVIVGGKAYTRAVASSVLEGVILNALQKEDYRTSNFIYDASLGILIDRKTDYMIRWSGKQNRWIVGYLNAHGKLENEILSRGATPVIERALGKYDKTIFKSSEWMDKVLK